MSNKVTRESIVADVLENTPHRLMILEHATGVGKSYSSLKIMEKVKPKKILLMVKETSHKVNWTEEFVKWGLEQWLEVTTIECYASLKKYTNTTWDMIILDEVHNLNQNRMIMLSTIKSNIYVALSATIEPRFKQYLCSILKIGIDDVYHSKVSLSQAIYSGILPQPNIYLIPLILKNEKPTEVLIEKRGYPVNRQVIHCSFKDRLKYLKGGKYRNVEVHIKCTEAEKYIQLTNNVDYWKEEYMRNYSQAAHNYWMQAAITRKRFLGNAKTEHVKPILNKLKDSRYICFCASVKQAKELGAKTAIHSKNKKSEETLESFQRKDINSIFAVGMLTEGQNLVDIDAGIIIQLDSKERSYLQKSGRVLRSKEPKQYIFYYKNTQDEKYLSTIIEDIPKEFYSILKL